MMKRDLIGFGRHRPKVTWPNGAQVAVSLVVNFEEGAEFSLEQGDAETERFSEVVSVLRPGVRDIGVEQIFNYGTRVGLWRFLDAFDRHDIRATFYMCGRAVERSPQLAAEIVSKGHEPACHGWRWRPHADFRDPQEEKASIQQCIDAIEAATGRKPVGFNSRGSISIWTRQVLSEMGFVYESSSWDDELPYYDDSVGPSPLLIVPYTMDCNDMKFFHPNGFVEAAQFSRYVADALEQLLTEARRDGRSSILNIGTHLRITGRPARFRAIETILETLSAVGDEIWIAPREDIARHWLKSRPYASTGASHAKAALTAGEISGSSGGEAMEHL
jgi:peptidoglycan/xylan/chitin deacetylase (PgdA/CDA1 family)